MSMQSASGLALAAMSEIPADFGFLAYMIMFYEGVGNLFPWNAFITASTYYSARFCGTDFEENFENYFSIAFTLSQTIGLAISIVFQNKLTLQQKIVWPLLAYSAIFALTTFFVTQKDIDADLLFWMTLFSLTMCGLCGAVLSSGLFGLGAMLPPAYTGALMNGQGLAGLIVASSSMLTLLSDHSNKDFCNDDDADDDDGDECPQEIDYSALAYFIIATVILLTCMLAYWTLKRLPFTLHYIERATTDEIDHSNDIDNPLVRSGHLGDAVIAKSGSAESLLDLSNHDRGSFAGRASREGSKERSSFSRPALHTVLSTKQPIIIEEEDPLEEPQPSDTPSTRKRKEEKIQEYKEAHSFSHIWKVFKQIETPALSVIFTFLVTIGLFPSLTVFLESAQRCDNIHNRFTNDLYVPFFFVMFNLFDLLGRLAAGAFNHIFTAQNIWMPAAARIIFFPMFLLCNISGSQLPVVFKNDAWPIVFMMFFALSNGYVASSCMMLGGSIVEAKESALAGTIMVFALTFGLLCGAMTSFPVVYISQGHL